MPALLRLLSIMRSKAKTQKSLSCFMLEKRDFG